MKKSFIFYPEFILNYNPLYGLYKLYSIRFNEGDSKSWSVKLSICLTKKKKKNCHLGRDYIFQLACDILKSVPSLFFVWNVN